MRNSIFTRLLISFTLLFLLGFVLWLNRNRLFLLPVSVQPRQETHYVQQQTNMRLNLNTATREELMELPGIGEVLADRILEYREQYFGFEELSELTEVKGIGEHTLAMLEEYLYIEPEEP